MDVIRVLRTPQFAEWLHTLKDLRAKARIAERVARLEFGNPGQSRSVGYGVVELKIDYGPGYRVCYVRRGSTLILLLCGGDKRTQRKDIRKAAEIAEQFHQE